MFGKMTTEVGSKLNSMVLMVLKVLKVPKVLKVLVAVTVE